MILRRWKCKRQCWRCRRRLGRGFRLNSTHHLSRRKNRTPFNKNSAPSSSSLEVNEALYVAQSEFQPWKPPKSYSSLYFSRRNILWNPERVMGVGGKFWDLLKPYTRNEGFDFLRNKRVAVDLSFWIVQHETAIKGNARNPHLRLTFFRTLNLFSKVWTAIFVLYLCAFAFSILHVWFPRKENEVKIVSLLVLSMWVLWVFCIFKK